MRILLLGVVGAAFVFAFGFTAVNLLFSGNPIETRVYAQQPQTNHSADIEELQRQIEELRALIYTLISAIDALPASEQEAADAVTPTPRPTVTPRPTPTPRPAATPSPRPTATPSHRGGSDRGSRPTNPAISLERAIEIAYDDLARRGITADFRRDSGIDWERGQWVWELEFRVPNASRGRRVIEFYINVDTGSIVKFEQGD